MMLLLKVGPKLRNAFGQKKGLVTQKYLLIGQTIRFSTLLYNAVRISLLT